MPLGTLDRTPPPFFRQGASAFSKLMVFSALALFLMVADARFKLTQPLRLVVAAILYPVQWTLMQPVSAAQWVGQYLTTVHIARANEETMRQRLQAQTLRAVQVEQLNIENTRLRKLLDLRERFGATTLGAQVLYDAADPYTRKVIIDKGQAAGVLPGSPVLDETGVLGQVTRVYLTVSEVTLVTDRDQAIPVLNTRTGLRAVAFGDPLASSGALEVRFMAANADIQPGDLLTTSGVDGVYPPGLPVARVAQVDRRVDSAFARIHCTPVALVDGVTHVMVLQPVGNQMPERPKAEAAPEFTRKGRSR